MCFSSTLGSVRLKQPSNFTREWTGKCSVNLGLREVRRIITYFDVLLTVHLSMFILVINQLEAQNLFYNKFISCLYMFRAPCAHRQEVKILLCSLWYHHNYRWPSRAQAERRVLSQPVHQTAIYRRDDTRGCKIQF